jgi:hypothetical protein
MKTLRISNIMLSKKQGSSAMKFVMLGLVSYLMVFGLFATAWAGGKTEKCKVVAPIVKMEFFSVPDMKGHVVGVLERRGVAIYENGETPAYHSMILFDSTKETGGTWNGYEDLSFADGSMTIIKSQGTIEAGTPRLVKGTGQYIKGTGRFEGIKGEVSFNCKSATPYTPDTTKGDLVCDNTLTYTLPKK